MPQTFGYYGGKTTHLKHILPLLPESKTFVELFAGTAAVFFNRTPRSKCNVLNDADDVLITMLRVMRDQPEELRAKLRLTPHSRSEFMRATLEADNDLELARQAVLRIYGVLQHSLGRHTPGQFRMSYRQKLCDFGRVAERVLELGEYLQGTHIENKDALTVMRRVNKEPVATDLLVYADPPYPRITRGDYGKTYRVEMDDLADHAALLTELCASPHRVALSGYRNELYDDMLAGWHRHDWQAGTTVANNHAHLKHKQARTESLWCNYAAGPTDDA